MELYIVVKEYNDYDQHGGYFIGVYDTYEKAKNSVNHFGRVNDENEWYTCLKIPINTTLKEDDYNCIQIDKYALLSTH